MGLKEMQTSQSLDPLSAYRSLIKDVGFTVIKEEITTQPLDLFFTHQPVVLRRLKERFRDSKNPAYASGEEFPREILEIQFVDYVLV